MKRPHLETRRVSLLLAALFFTAPAAAADLTLSWVDGSDSELGFLIERRTSDGSFVQIADVAENVTSFIDSGLTGGTTFCYRVRAYNGAGVSAYTNEACQTAGAESSPPPSLTLRLNRDGIRPGDLLQASVAGSNPGSARPVDVYYGALLPPNAGPSLGCPAGDPLALLTVAGVVVSCLSAAPPNYALARGIVLPGSSHASMVLDPFPWPPGTPPGSYTFLLAFTLPDAGLNGLVDGTNIVAVATAVIVVFP